MARSAMRRGAVASDPGSVMAARFHAQMLTGSPATSTVEVVRRIVAVQAQDARGFRLAVRARTRELTAADVDRALADRSLVLTWLNRGTLHLVTASDYWWLHALTAPTQLTMNTRRLEQEHVSTTDANRGVALIIEALHSRGPLNRHQLRTVLAAKEVPTAGQALIQLLLRASLLGHIVRGPMVERAHAYVLVSDWLSAPPSVERDNALGELARRFLAGHGPASDRDLAKWSGLPLKDVRRGFAAIEAETVEIGEGMCALEGVDAPRDAAPPPRLLGPFEPVLMGWTSRTSILGAAEAALVTKNGMFRPFALVNGRAVATWRFNRNRVELEPFARLHPLVSDALYADGDAVVRFLNAR